MRIWDVSPSLLCRQHLLGEHRELHGLWNIITQNKSGYAQHPETKRWVGKSQALYTRHSQLVSEMEKRGYTHATPLDKTLATGQATQDVLLHTKAEQLLLLQKKGCLCRV